MNPRDRILAAIRHQPVDRLPTDIWATPEVWERLYKTFGLAGLSAADQLELYTQMGIDGIFSIAPPYIGPDLPVQDGIHYDEWGMGYRILNYATGAYDEQVIFPLAQAQTLADLEAFAWPSPDWYDYSALPHLAAQFPERAIECGYTAVFFWHNRLRGLEQSLTDPLLNPEFTQELIRRVSDFFTEYHTRCFTALHGRMDLTQVTDDFGGQFGLLISPRIFDQFYRQPIQRAIDLAKAHGILVFHHDDGDCRRLLPRLIEMGIDVLNPVQWRCGDWDLAALKQQFGAQVCFHSAVDNQHTLPFGTPAEVRAGTGFILGPCHNLQPLTPTENILAMYAEAAQIKVGEL